LVVSSVSDDFSSQDLTRIEATTQEVGRQVFAQISRKRPNLFQRRWWDDRIMAWAMQDESVKVQMFRFIDVLPMLKSREQVTGHLQEYFDEVKQRLPAAVRLGLAMAPPQSITGRALAIAARRNAMSHARRFIAGTTAEEVLAAALRARKNKMAFTMDLLGEAVLTDAEADHYLQATIDLIRNISPTVNSWPEIPQTDRGWLATIPRVNVSIKLSALDSQFDAVDQEGTERRVSQRLRTLLRAAREHQAFINVDMESYATKDLTLRIFKNILDEDEFREVSDVGIVIQCYLKDAGRDLVGLRDWARQRGRPIWVRLVKGAYWDYETVHSNYHGWHVPVFQEKWQSDVNFEQQTRFVFHNHEFLRPALGSHNIRSLAHGIAVARQLGLPVNTFELQMLYGMADAEKQVFADLGHRMRVYMPYGELIPGMAYLVRRLLENTSNDSFLRASFTESLPVEELLRNPAEHARHKNGVGSRFRAANRYDHSHAGIPHEKGSRPLPVCDDPDDERNETMPSPLPEFKNEPPADFARADCREAMKSALAEVASHLGRHYPMVIGGEKIDTDKRSESINPSHKNRIVGTTASATAQHAADAVAAAVEAFPAWAARDVASRAEFLRRAAEAMRRRRYELAAWEVYECGKGWREADGDICEAIDFCEYYASGAIALQGRPLDMDVSGEENQYHYMPRGVAVVIAPWNFPLAILTGMTVAALATGNTVIMKPSEQSAVIAAKLMDIFEQVELPTGVLNYLPGPGRVVGAALVEHPDTSIIAFTGSREVGLAINVKAAEVSAATGRASGGRQPPGASPHRAPEVKRVISEMGGKNAIIIDEDADLDEAVQGVVKSAFGYQGQKCSACSRCVVLEPVYETFLARLVEATRSLQIGPAEDPGARVGPVIDQKAYDGIRSYIEIGRREGKTALAMDVGALANEGFYIGPHIFADVPPSARIAQEEIFGPVLAVLRARSLDHAFEIANGTDYALTGGIYSRSPRNLERARHALQVGNLYLNRPITGALVARQPFGGFHMSGIGSKAGGPDYLLQFVLPRTVTEYTMRRGFAPKTEMADSQGV
jgi:RHH-type proline utilization regulon transcriptional repressor/proline dehydrogenase/delta 1-pyrroline-5-carboxylate dehydrogenase